MKKRMLMVLLILVCIAIMVFPGCKAKKSVSITVSAAASIQNAMQEIETQYKKDNPSIELILNYASSGALQKQIEQGAPVDVFLSASSSKMDKLQDKDLIINDTRIDLLKNSIILITPSDFQEINTFDDLNNSKVKKIALGAPESSPAGKYAKEALQTLGLWEQIQDKLVLAKDVRQVLSYVETGNVDAGIVYRTDIINSDKVSLISEAPEETHTPIVYPVAIVKSCEHIEEAKGFISFLESEAAKNIFKKYGFKAAQ